MLGSCYVNCMVVFWSKLRSWRAASLESGFNVLRASWTSQDDKEESASAAKLEDLRVQAASQGVEWLRLALSQIRRKEIRALAAAAGVKRYHADGNWLPVVQLRSELLNALMPATQARMYSMFEVVFDSVVDMRGT